MLDAVIVEPALDKRTNLREIARNFCNSVAVASTLKDGLERVRYANNCDVIYVSSRFDLDLAGQFVSSTRETDAGSDSANLLIGSSDSGSESFIARLTLKGFDGMLLEPASVDTFRVSAELALKVRKQRLEERQKKSLDVMVRSLAHQLDEVATKKKLNQSTILCQDRFRKLCNEILVLDLKTQATYFSSLIDLFVERPPPVLEPVYSGASQRASRRLNKS